jgi:hypothetical protein
VIIETCDKRTITISKAIAIKSEVIRQILDDVFCFELDNKENIIPLHHESCTFQTLTLIVNCLSMDDEEGRAHTLNKALQECNDIMPALTAVNFLEIQDMLFLMARTVGILHTACAAGNIDAVKALIESNADVITRDSHGLTAIEVTTDSACKEEIERAIFLADGWTPLMVNARWGDTERIKSILLQDGEAAVHARNSDGSCRAALHYAAERGHTAAVLELLRAKAMVDIVDKARYPTHPIDAAMHTSHGLRQRKPPPRHTHTVPTGARGPFPTHFPASQPTLLQRQVLLRRTRTQVPAADSGAAVGPNAALRRRHLWARCVRPGPSGARRVRRRHGAREPSPHITPDPASRDHRDSARSGGVLSPLAIRRHGTLLPDASPG